MMHGHKRHQVAVTVQISQQVNQLSEIRLWFS